MSAPVASGAAAAAAAGPSRRADLLRALLAGGATIRSCSRREPALQEVLDGIGGGRQQ